MIASFKQAVYGFEDFTDDDIDEQSQEFESQLGDYQVRFFPFSTFDCYVKV